MKAMTNMFNSDINTEFIRYMKYVGVLESPNNIIKYSYNPYLMANAVLGMLKDRRRRLVGGGCEWKPIKIPQGNSTYVTNQTNAPLF
jgi:methionine synthase I (cobalamin-dependent)